MIIVIYSYLRYFFSSYYADNQDTKYKTRDDFLMKRNNMEICVFEKKKLHKKKT